MLSVRHVKLEKVDPGGPAKDLARRHSARGYRRRDGGGNGRL